MDNCQEDLHGIHTIMEPSRKVHKNEDKKQKVKGKLSEKAERFGCLQLSRQEDSKLCAQLEESLLEYVKSDPVTLYKKKYSPGSDEYITQLHRLTHKGLYNEKILKTIIEKGLREEDILRAMKYGLIDLDYYKLRCYEDFHVFPEILHNEDSCIEILNDQLISTLKSVGLSDIKCWHIIIHGLVSQDETTLLKLAISGIDVPGILHWQGKFVPVSEEILKFLAMIGIEENVLKFLEENGIDNKSQQILKKMEYTGMMEEELRKASLSACSSSTSIVLRTSDLKIKLSDQTIFNNKFKQKCTRPYICTCHSSHEAKINCQTELRAQRNDYLRQNVMVPLAWALAQTLQYKPSDPLHYTAYKLLQWKYGNVPEREKIAIGNSVAAGTLEMDGQLIV